jgi:hypothetical protein
MSHYIQYITSTSHDTMGKQAKATNIPGSLSQDKKRKNVAPKAAVGALKDLQAYGQGRAQSTCHGPRHRTGNTKKH